MNISSFGSRKTAKTLLLLVTAILLLNSIYQDAQNSMAQPFDLRNRITGSRIMKDGGSPYFYIWQEGDTVRYYDIHISPKAIVSQSTATPFFHWITEYFADFPQHKINVFWFCMQYAMLGAICLLTFLCLPPPQRRKGYIILLIAGIFTYTVGWRMHVSAGQYYLSVPLLATVCWYCLLQKRDWLHLGLFAVCGAALILIRPITPLLFVPLLFHPKKYFAPLAGIGLAIGLYALFVWFTPLQKQNWEDYFTSLKVHTGIHQASFNSNEPFIENTQPIRSFEGINLDTDGGSYWNKKLREGSEMGNFYVLYEGILHRPISLKGFVIIEVLACSMVLFPLLLLKRRKVTFSVEQLLLTGFLLYTTFEFFNPTIRAIYHWVQYLFPVMLVVACYRKILLLSFLLMAVGIYLNILVSPLLKMEHTIGEMLFNAGMVLIVYRQLFVNDTRERNWELRSNLLIM